MLYLWTMLYAAANQGTTFVITDTKLYVPVVTLSADDDRKRTINWNKYLPKKKTQNSPNRYSDYLIDPCFHGVNRLFVLAFDINDNRIGQRR